jgi:hypothetical protein
MNDKSRDELVSAVREAHRRNDWALAETLTMKLPSEECGCNFLKETSLVMHASGVCAEMVHSVALRPSEYNFRENDDAWKRCTWAEFEAWADRDYDSSYGGNEVSLRLLVIGANWWMERHEYDGSEWWEFKRQPVVPDDADAMSDEDIWDEYAPQRNQ